jgi:hypothetical protein
MRGPTSPLPGRGVDPITAMTSGTTADRDSTAIVGSGPSIYPFFSYFSSIRDTARWS